MKQHIKSYIVNILPNNLKYSRSEGTYCIIYGVNISFFVLYFFSINITTNQFHIDNKYGNIGIFYEMIIGQYLMVQPGLISNIKCNNLECDCASLFMKNEAVMQ